MIVAPGTPSLPLMRNMTPQGTFAATALAAGRPWSSANRAALTDFPDCSRVELYWNDGALAYMLHDTAAAALEQLGRLGFSRDQPQQQPQ